MEKKCVTFRLLDSFSTQHLSIFPVGLLGYPNAWCCGTLTPRVQVPPGPILGTNINSMATMDSGGLFPLGSLALSLPPALKWPQILHPNLLWHRVTMTPLLASDGQVVLCLNLWQMGLWRVVNWTQHISTLWACQLLLFLFYKRAEKTSWNVGKFHFPSMW